MDEQGDGKESLSLLLTVPIELLIYLISFLPTRDKLKLRFVSRKLRSVCETPSLWRDFVWPYYHNGDDDYVHNVLKLYGQYVKRISFYHGLYRVSRENRAYGFVDSKLDSDLVGDVTHSQLLKYLEYCNNLTELSLPTIEMDPKKFGKVLLSMRNLQKLDVRCHDIQALLDVISVNLEELTIRKEPNSNWNGEIIGPWVDYWMSKKFAPQKVNIVTAHSLWISGTHSLWMQQRVLSDTVPLTAMLNSWIKLNSESPTGRSHTGSVKLYGPLKNTLNLVPTYPLFELSFGNNVTSPFVKASSCGLPGDLLVLTSTMYGGRVMFKATTSDDLQNKEVPSYSTITSLEFVTEFDISFKEILLSEHLKQLAVACPNLQRLNLKNNRHCLKTLEGLSAITSHCHNLQGLNLMGIPVTEIEDQIQLWEMLTDMKLTHLAVNMCVLLPNKQHCLFQKCTNLQALESKYCQCHPTCVNRFVDKCLLVLSQFPSLIHIVITLNPCSQVKAHAISPQLRDILANCKKLKYLRYVGYLGNKQFLLPTYACNLEQIYIMSKDTDLSDTFLSAISAHGGLVHVVLYVSSVTSKGVSVLVRNSPKLMGFHATLYDVNFIYQYNVKQFSHRKLFVMGNFTIDQGRIPFCEPTADADDEHCCITNLSSLW